MIDAGGPTVIHLAREPPFALGEMDVPPSTREVVVGDRRETLEPRIMQVLVALARRRGEVVSRDDLIGACWGGRAVVDGAIYRCIAAIRRLGEASGALSIKTVARVGYRLVASEPPTELGSPPLPADARPLATATTPEPVLAVLAFDNLCDGADMTWFSDGVSEEILQTVARTVALKVIGRGSSFQFRGADKAAARVSAALKATHVLDGSVRRSGSRLRIAANLIECAGETTLWSDQFDRDLSEVFALQDEISAAVAAGMKRVLAPGPRAEAIDPAAYDLYLKARAIWNFNRLEPRVERTVLLEQATRLAPNFAGAWLHLAGVRAARLRFDGPDHPYAASHAKALEAAETALRLDPGLGSAYQILGQLEPFGSHMEREALHRKALATAPDSPGVLAGMGSFCADVGRIHEAVSFTRRAYALDPMTPFLGNQLGYLLDWDGQYQESRVLWGRFLDLWPDAEPIASNAFSAAAQNADWDRFENIIKIIKERGTYPQVFERYVGCLRNLRNPDLSYRRFLLHLVRDDVDKKGNSSLMNWINLYRLDCADEAFELIDQASFAYVFNPERRWPNGAMPVGNIFSVVENMAMLRDPRFPRLCAKLGLCDYWVKSGRWPDCAEAVAPYYDFKSEARRLAAAPILTSSRPS